MESKESLFVPPNKELKQTFVHDLVKYLPIDKERVRYIDLTENEVASPPFGFSVGENQFMIGAGKLNPDARYLVTDKLVDCTALVIESKDRERYLLGHIMGNNFVHKMFERFRESLGNPDEVGSITVVPGFLHDSPVDARIQAILTESSKMNPSLLNVDIASGEPYAYRGIVQDTIGGGLYGLSQPVDKGVTLMYNSQWAKSVL